MLVNRQKTDACWYLVQEIIKMKPWRGRSQTLLITFNNNGYDIAFFKYFNFDSVGPSRWRNKSVAAIKSMYNFKSYVS